MSDATGLGPNEVAVLGAFDAVGARPGTDYVKTQNVLDWLYRASAIGPGPAYRIVCDLARPDVSHLRLIDFNGNYGSFDFAAAAARYTESRLTPLGAACVAAERGDIAALPVGLINGDIHVEGTKTPFDPGRLLDAIRASATGAGDDVVNETVGLPSFPTGCKVVADIAEFRSGRSTELELRAVIENFGTNELRISRLPPGVGPSEVCETLQGWLVDSEHRSGGRSVIADISDRTMFHGPTEIFVSVREPEVRARVAAIIAELWGVRTTQTVTLGIPLADLIRQQTTRLRGTDLDAHLAVIAEAKNFP